MPNRTKDIELIPDTSVASGWKVKHNGKVGDHPGQGQGGYPQVDVMGGPNMVIFKLPPNKPGENIVFNKTDPIDILPGTSSPTQKGLDPEFDNWAIFDNGKTLVVLDVNSKPGDYSYRVKADGYAPVLDPIIKNGGGPLTSPTAPSPTYSMTEIGIGLLLAFLVGFFVNRLFFGRPKTAS